MDRTNSMWETGTMRSYDLLWAILAVVASACIVAGSPFAAYAIDVWAAEPVAVESVHAQPVTLQADEDAPESAEDPASGEGDHASAGDDSAAGEDASVVEVADAEALSTNLSSGGDLTVKLTADISSADQVSVKGDKTLDLNGRTLSGSVEQFVRVESSASLTVQDSSAGSSGKITSDKSWVMSISGKLTLAGGTIEASESAGIAMIVYGSGSFLTMTGGKINGGIQAQWAKLAINGGSVTASESKVAVTLFASNASMSGDASIAGGHGVYLANLNDSQGENREPNSPSSTSSTFIMNGGSITSRWFGITGNNGRSARCKAAIYDGTIKSEYAAVYWPMEGELTINGGKLSGLTAVEAKMGEISIAGGELTGTGENKYCYSGGGSDADGSAVKLVCQSYGSSPGQYIESPNLSASISSCTLNSEHGNAVTVYVDTVDNKADVTISDTAVLNPASGRDPVRVTSCSDFQLNDDGVSTSRTTITGGDLVNAAAIAGGKVDVGEGSVIDGHTLYSSVSAAVADTGVYAASNGAITLLRDVTEDVTIPAGVVVQIDLGGHDLTGTVTNNGTLTLSGSGTLYGQVVGDGTLASADGVVAVASADGGVKYLPFENALNSVQPGDTIMLLGDVYMSSGVVIDKSITIEGGGHTIHGDPDDAGVRFEVTGGTFTIKNAMLTGFGENAATGSGIAVVKVPATADVDTKVVADSVTVEDFCRAAFDIRSGTFELSGCTIDCAPSQPAGALTKAVVAGLGENPVTGLISGTSVLGAASGFGDWSAAGIEVFNNAEVAISGGSISGCAIGVSVDNYWSAGAGAAPARVSIDGTEIDAGVDGDAVRVYGSKDSGGQVAGAEVSIAGGTFTGDIRIANSDGSSREAIAISGGSFDRAPDRAYLASGFVISQNADGTFSVAKYRPPVIPPKPDYAITVPEAEHGKVTVDPERAKAGEEVTVAAEPDEGFEVASVTVTGKDGKAVEVTASADGTWTFEMPKGGATVEVAFACDGGELCPTAGLADVDQSKWYHLAVDWAVETGLMEGYEGTGLFGTGDPLTRAQLAQMLYNRAGAPEVEPADGFADVDAADWFAPAVAWASSEGLLTGYGDGAFGPDDALTREQLAVVFWRMAGEPAAEADLSGFPDGDETSAWAVEAMEWAVSTGLLEGYTDTGRLDPAGDFTRAQAATVFFRQAEAATE